MFGRAWLGLALWAVISACEATPRDFGPAGGGDTTVQQNAPGDGGAGDPGGAGGFGDGLSASPESVSFGPVPIGFAAPVLLLLTAYLELGRRARRSELRAGANMAAEATRVLPPDAARFPHRQAL